MRRSNHRRQSRYQANVHYLTEEGRVRLKRGKRHREWLALMSRLAAVESLHHVPAPLQRQPIQFIRWQALFAGRTCSCWAAFCRGTALHALICRQPSIRGRGLAPCAEGTASATVRGERGRSGCLGSTTKRHVLRCALHKFVLAVCNPDWWGCSVRHHNPITAGLSVGCGAATTFSCGGHSVVVRFIHHRLLLAFLLELWLTSPFHGCGWSCGGLLLRLAVAPLPVQRQALRTCTGSRILCVALGCYCMSSRGLHGR